MLDKIVDIATDYGKGKIKDKVQDTLVGKADENEKTTFGGGLLRFVISLVWFAITLVALYGSFVTVAASFVNSLFELPFISELSQLMVPMLCLTIAVGVITFLVPYLRKKGSFTRWCGVLCIMESIAYIYLLVTGFGIN